MSISVAPLVGAWIEIVMVSLCIRKRRVAPLVGAWIEIFSRQRVTCFWESLPSWERGLKFKSLKLSIHCFWVAPLVGAWIEIVESHILSVCHLVAPLVGAWIEIVQDLYCRKQMK